MAIYRLRRALDAQCVRRSIFVHQSFSVEAHIPLRPSHISSLPIRSISTQSRPNRKRQQTCIPQGQSRKYGTYPTARYYSRPVVANQVSRAFRPSVCHRDQARSIATHSIKTATGRTIKVYPAPLSAHKKCPDPIAHITSLQLQTLDPTSNRTRLFDPANPDCVKLGDTILVRTRTGDPFAGVLMSVRRRGIDTGILLRNQLTRVGVEMWYKIYSPSVEGMEIVERANRRARRARLYYLRKPKHDKGSVQVVLQQYLRRQAALRSGTPGALQQIGKGKKGKKGKK